MCAALFRSYGLHRTIKGSARKAVVAITDDFLGRALITHRQASAPSAYFQQFSAQSRPASATQPRKAFAQRLDDRHSQRFSGRLRDFASQASGLWVLDA
jgi:hypothetical protein